jgi:hypothetical protein
MSIASTVNYTANLNIGEDFEMMVFILDTGETVIPVSQLILHGLFTLKRGCSHLNRLVLCTGEDLVKVHLADDKIVDCITLEGFAEFLSSTTQSVLIRDLSKVLMRIALNGIELKLRKSH